MKNMHVVMATILLGEGRTGTSASSVYSAGPRPSAMVDSCEPEPKSPPEIRPSLMEDLSALVSEQFDAAMERDMFKVDKKPTPLLFCTCGGAYPYQRFQSSLGINDRIHIPMGAEAVRYINAGAKAFDSFGNEWTIVEKAKPATIMPEPKKERRLVPCGEAISYLQEDPLVRFAWSFAGRKYSWCTIHNCTETNAGGDIVKASNIPDFLYLDPPEET